MTDTITVPRALLEQALEALEKAHHAMQSDMSQDQIGEAIAALRSALEQPQQEDPDLLTAYLYGFEKGKDLYGSYRVTQHGNCVDSRYTWRPIDDKTPMGVKIQVLTVGGIATHVRLTLNTKNHYTHWTPLPRKP